ncbi:MAG: hypothetical protein KAW12_03815 [Candidatus Aminicenantes bacterium]|nr:hypothetical protein [Candidatus Aminicenantes bacterium]
MPEQCFYLDELLPVEVFEILAAAAEKFRGKYLKDIRVIFPGQGNFRFATLEVPDPYAEIGKERGAGEERKETLLSVVRAFKDKMGKDPKTTHPGGTTITLREGAGLLFWHSAAEAAGAETEVEQNEYLIVTPEIETDRAELLFKNLQFHATYTYVGGTGASSGSPAYRYLFYVKDDLGRRSTFSSIEAAGILEQCRVLKGFRVDERSVFLPKERRPGAGSLQAFCFFLESAPLLFGGLREENGGLLAALAEWPLPQKTTAGTAALKLDFMYLKGLRFYRMDRFTRRKVSHAVVQYMSLTESRAGLEQLAEKISRAKPYVGYRLELRSTRHFEKNSAEKLRRQKEQIETSLAYLESIAKPRPVLMRFTQAQLPALAAEIRSYHMSVISEGRIKYGFQAEAAEPAGYHFLLVESQEVSRETLDPLPLWEDIKAPHMRFRLDPLWARFYFEPSGSSLVFVPEGTVLYPTMHHWEQAGMDQYLRETMSWWFSGRLDGGKIPQRPIYIFDGPPHPDAKITISILDREKLEPLHLRLGWLNDNLIAMHESGGVEPFIRDIASAAGRKNLTRQISAETANVEAEFSRAALEAGKRIAHITGQTTSALSRAVEEVVESTFRTVTDLRKLSEDISKWEKDLTDIKLMAEKLKSREKDTAVSFGKKRKEFAGMVENMDKELEKNSRRRSEIEEKVAEQVRSLETSYLRIQKALGSLRL